MKAPADIVAVVMQRRKASRERPGQIVLSGWQLLIQQLPTQQLPAARTFLSSLCIAKPKATRPKGDNPDHVYDVREKLQDCLLSIRALWGPPL